MTEAQRQWRAANLDKVHASQKRWRDANRAPGAPGHAKFNLYLCNRNLVTRYGITLERKQEMSVEQNHSCAICEKPFETLSKAHVDHCHATGNVRGLLCYRCNANLGWWEKRSKNVEAYLSP